MRVLLTILLIAQFWSYVTVHGQTSSMRFEAASVRRAQANGAGMSMRWEGGRFVMTNGFVHSLIAAAYPSDTGELLGAPDWMSKETFDVVATTNVIPTLEQRQAMLRALLSERFKLTVHSEFAERDVYVMVLASTDGRLGPQLRRSPLDCAAFNAAREQRRSVEQLPAPSNGAPPCGIRVTDAAMMAGGVPMSSLAGTISGAAGRKVIDRTGLDGYYEITLRFVEASLSTQSDTDNVSIFSAVREQLGLRLEPRRERMSVVVLDRVERPTPD
jgi:uncharacterized protein (TIGR03435 family)